MTFKNKVIAGFGTALAILLLVAALSYRSVVQSNDDRVWVTHTHQVLETFDDVFANVLDVESGVRGYILTGDESYLGAYTIGLGQVGQDVKKLRELTADNPVQQKSLDQLEPLIAARLQRAEYMVAIRSHEGLAAVVETPQMGAGKELVAHIRELLDSMKREEARLLQLRMQEADRSLRSTKMLIAGGDALSIVFLCGAGFVIAQEMKRRRLAEEVVMELNADLERRVEERTVELDSQTKELARSNSELQQFAYVASHDLQEPLRMVASFTQLLEKRYADQLDDDARDFINFAVDGAKRMQTLISDLLNYSRVGTQGKPLEFTDCNVVLQRVLEGLNLAIDENRATITYDPLPRLLADSLQLGQLFQNLVTNAMKFRGADPPRIHISAHAMGKAWEFSFRDNGIGIAQEHADRIFVIFQRLHTKTEYPGTGIGLAICKKIVERHGGRIWLEPSPGGGTTFIFTISAIENQMVDRIEKNELRKPVCAH